MRHYKLIAVFAAVNLLAASLGIVAFRDSDKEPLPILKGHRYWVQHVAFSPDGKLLASAAGMLDRAGEVILWDVATGEERLHLGGHNGAVNAVAFSPNGALLATANEDHTVRL